MQANSALMSNSEATPKHANIHNAEAALHPTTRSPYSGTNTPMTTMSTSHTSS